MGTREPPTGLRMGLKYGTVHRGTPTLFSGVHVYTLERVLLYSYIYTHTLKDKRTINLLSFSQQNLLQVFNLFAVFSNNPRLLL